MRYVLVFVAAALLCGGCTSEAPAPAQMPPSTQVQAPATAPVALAEGFVRVPAGTFPMGSAMGSPDGAGHEPQHDVTLTYAYELQAHEVTQAEWQDLMGSAPWSFVDCGPQCPVERINWYDALAYANALSARYGLEPCYDLSACEGEPGLDYACEAVEHLATTPQRCRGYRLPTEAEWERAARADTHGTYGPSDTPSGLTQEAWYEDNADRRPHPVGTLAPNPWGLTDMLGNVFEWCDDRYGGVATGPATNPVNASEGEARVLRGGAWASDAMHVRPAYRHTSTPDVRSRFYGFRLARTLPTRERI